VTRKWAEKTAAVVGRWGRPPMKLRAPEPRGVISSRLTLVVSDPPSSAGRSRVSRPFCGAVFIHHGHPNRDVTRRGAAAGQLRDVAHGIQLPRWGPISRAMMSRPSSSTGETQVAALASHHPATRVNLRSGHLNVLLSYLVVGRLLRKSTATLEGNVKSLWDPTKPRPLPGARPTPPTTRDLTRLALPRPSPITSIAVANFHQSSPAVVSLFLSRAIGPVAAPCRPSEGRPGFAPPMK